MDIGEKLIESLEIKTIFTIKIGSLSIPVTETVVITWVVMAVLIISAILLVRCLKEAPSGAGALLEGAVEALNKFAEGQFGKYSKIFAPYIGTVFLYLILANLLPAITPTASFGREPLFDIKPPARDINVGAALAVLTILIVIISGIASRGLKGWLKTLIEPMPAMFPFNILEYAIKPVTLCLRLFGNMLGSFIIMTLIYLALDASIGISAGLYVIPSMYFDILDGLIQALVFTFLTALYISEAVKTHPE